MDAMASKITSLTIACSTVYSRRRSRKTPKLRVTGLCSGNSPETDEFPAQMASNAENVSFWWRADIISVVMTIYFYVNSTEIVSHSMIHSNSLLDYALSYAI